MIYTYLYNKIIYFFVLNPKILFNPKNRNERRSYERLPKRMCK